MMFTCQEQSTSLPFTCNFRILIIHLRIVIIFLVLYSHTPLFLINSGLSKSAGALLSAVLIYFTSNAKHFPAIVSDMRIINRCELRHSCTSRTHAHFGQSGNTVIKVFTCLYIVNKIGICHLC